MLASQDDCEIVKEMPSHGKDSVCLENVTTEKMNIVEDVSVLKLQCRFWACVEYKTILPSRQKRRIPKRGIHLVLYEMFVLKVELIPPSGIRMLVWKRCKPKWISVVQSVGKLLKVYGFPPRQYRVLVTNA